MKQLFPALWLALAAGIALAQEAPPPAPDCKGDGHRQFDFWLGEFEVRTPDGKLAGHNTIATMLGGCALTEHWRSASGNEGRSINFHDRSDGQWHQLWVDENGFVLRLAGGWNGESMVLSGTTSNREGATVQHRISWTPFDDGSVRQLWESSTDAGATWNTVFDGSYTRTH